MKTVQATIMIALMVAIFAQVACAKECTQLEAYAAESVTDYLDSWENLYRATRDFGHCDDGAIAEGFDEAVSVLLVKQWHNLPELLKHFETDNSFKDFILKRILSETVPAERWLSILKLAEFECPKNGNELCTAIIRASRTRPSAPP